MASWAAAVILAAAASLLSTLHRARLGSGTCIAAVLGVSTAEKRVVCALGGPAVQQSQDLATAPEKAKFCRPALLCIP